jgi:hypothetical protein
MPKKMKKLRMGSTRPPSGKAKEARGVAHTTAEAAMVMSKVTPKAIHHTLRPRRCNPRDFQPSLEYPSWVTTSSMIKVAKVGVMDHTENMIGSEEILRNLMSKAAPTARHSTRTVKIAALFVSVSFVNTPRILSLAEEPARRSHLAAGSW